MDFGYSLHKTKNVMKEENEIAKLQLQYKAYSQFTLTKTDEEILWNREYKMDKDTSLVVATFH